MTRSGSSRNFGNGNDFSCRDPLCFKSSAARNVLAIRSGSQRFISLRQQLDFVSWKTLIGDSKHLSARMITDNCRVVLWGRRPYRICLDISFVYRNNAGKYALSYVCIICVLRHPMIMYRKLRRRQMGQWGVGAVITDVDGNESASLLSSQSML